MLKVWKEGESGRYKVTDILIHLTQQTVQEKVLEAWQSTGNDQENNPG